MAHRPYPRTDRALHQLNRHDGETPPYRAPRPITPMERLLVDYATAAVQAAAPVVASMVAGIRMRPVGSEETSG